MPQPRKVILSLNIEKHIISKYKASKPIIIEFDSITEAEEKLHIDKSVLHKMFTNNQELEGILAIVTGNMSFVVPKATKATRGQVEMKKYLEKVAYYCEKHKVNYTKTISQCPLCKLDEAKGKFKMV
jgi:hypothetical protein